MSESLGMIATVYQSGNNGFTAMKAWIGDFHKI
jgi:hypothetical protein